MLSITRTPRRCPPVIDRTMGRGGHGLQQAPAMGRGLAEWLCFGSYQTLDLSEFHFDRLLSGVPQVEKAVI